MITTPPSIEGEEIENPGDNGTHVRSQNGGTTVAQDQDNGRILLLLVTPPTQTLYTVIHMPRKAEEVTTIEPIVGMLRPTTRLLGIHHPNTCHPNPRTMDILHIIHITLLVPTDTRAAHLPMLKEIRIIFDTNGQIMNFRGLQGWKAEQLCHLVGVEVRVSLPLHLPM
mmetsp:Transcript_16017/g.30298  ORF Transcript_16017/g.30298 Transcript_16017/m.30298 type:complete len:168 (+) Transcript_16017:799-1302(+)